MTDFIKLPISKGKYFTIVDPVDFVLLSQVKWCKRNGYAGRDEGGKCVYMHREIMQPPPGLVVDHINGDTLDNRRCNLRVCTTLQNTQNRKTGKKARRGYKGVQPKRDRWSARIRVEKEELNLGIWDTQEEAAMAYDMAARYYHSQFCQTNFPGTEKLDYLSIRKMSLRQSNRSRTSIYRGVYWRDYGNGRGKWSAQTKKDGKRILLGVFDDEIAAAMAYDVAAKKLGFPRNWLNFPD